MTLSLIENLTPQGIDDSPWSFRHGKHSLCKLTVWRVTFLKRQAVVCGLCGFVACIYHHHPSSTFIWLLGWNRKGHQGLGWSTSQHEGRIDSNWHRLSMLDTAKAHANMVGKAWNIQWKCLKYPMEYLDVFHHLRSAKDDKSLSLPILAMVPVALGPSHRAQRCPAFKLYKTKVFKHFQTIIYYTRFFNVTVFLFLIYTGLKGSLDNILNQNGKRGHLIWFDIVGKGHLDYDISHHPYHSIIPIIFITSAGYCQALCTDEGRLLDWLGSRVFLVPLTIQTSKPSHTSVRGISSKDLSSKFFWSWHHC